MQDHIEEVMQEEAMLDHTTTEVVDTITKEEDIILLKRLNLLKKMKLYQRPPNFALKEPEDTLKSEQATEEQEAADIEDILLKRLSLLQRQLYSDIKEEATIDTEEATIDTEEATIDTEEATLDTEEATIEEDIILLKKLNLSKKMKLYHRPLNSDIKEEATIDTEEATIDTEEATLDTEEATIATEEDIILLKMLSLSKILILRQLITATSK